MFNFSSVSAIIFDLDDTLVKTQLDFVQLKKEINCPVDHDILSFIECLPSYEERVEAERKVREHELSDAQTSTWLLGAKEFVTHAQRLKLPMAIVTRNCKEALEIKIEKNQIPISTYLSREDAPAKPNPSALLMLASKWALTPSKIAYIGDYKYDIQAAHNANMQAWWFDVKQLNEGLEFASCLSFIPKA